LLYRNIEFSKKELQNLIRKYPIVDNDKSKGYILFIRSMVRSRRALKNLATADQKLEFSLNQNVIKSETEHCFNKFVDYIFNIIRIPTLPLPQNRDEIM
jgi:hypothetical protein